MRMQKVSYVNLLYNDVASCFCTRADERRKFVPAHLQTVGDHDFDVINGITRGQLREDIIEVPCIPEHVSRISRSW